MHTCTASLPSILTPCACFWNCLMCASPYIPFCRPRPGAEECFRQVTPTKVPTSISSTLVPTVSPNAPRPHPIPLPKTYSPHRHALSYALMSGLCSTSMRLCFSIVSGAADFEQLRSRPAALSSVLPLARALPPARAALRASATAPSRMLVLSGKCMYRVPGKGNVVCRTLVTKVSI